MIAVRDVWYPRGGETPETLRAAGSWDALAIPVFNASTEPGSLHLHYGRATEGRTTPPDLTDWTDGHPIPPLGLARPSYWLFDLDAEVTSWEPSETVTSVAVWVHGDDDADRRAFRITVDHAGLEGRPRRPVRWAPGAPDVIVHGGTGSDAGDAAALAAARYLQQVLWYHGDHVPSLVDAAEAPVDAPRVLLVGDATAIALPDERADAREELARLASEPHGDALLVRVLDERLSVLHGVTPAALRRAFTLDPFDAALAGRDALRLDAP